MTVTDDIKNRLDIVDIVSETVKLRKAGKSFSGFCPFHANVHTPAFVVFPDSGTWRCFGQCNEGGDIFKFVMKREGWDFAQTLKYLADRAGVHLEPASPQKMLQQEAGDRISHLLEEAVLFYRNQLLQTPPGQAASEFLHKRGLTDTTISAFGLGYAPAGWDLLSRHFQTKGVSEAELLEAGLVSERESGGTYDRFRNRIVIPIRTPTGQMAGFGARILDPNDSPKFINSPQTTIFDKGNLLFGLDAARKSIRQLDQAVIVEGYLDVIILHQAGFTNTVSPMGTALTEDQMRMLKKFTKRIILALDADAAGEKATLRGLEVAREAMDRSDELVFDVKGLLRHEGRLQADLRVTTIPEGMDPDEVVLRDPKEWQQILETAKPLVIHVMETLAAERDLADPKVKQEIAARVVPLIEDVPGMVERDTYRQRLARLLRVDESSLPGARVSKTGGQTKFHSNRQNVSAQAGKDAGNIFDPVLAMETHLLCVLFQQPDLLNRLDRMLQQGNLDRLSDGDINHTSGQILLQTLQQSVMQVEMDPSEYLIERCPASLVDTAKELQQMKLPADAKPDDLLVDIFRTVIRMRQQSINISLRELRFLQEEGQATTGDNIPYQDLVLKYTQQLLKLNLALGSLSRIKT